MGSPSLTCSDLIDFSYNIEMSINDKSSASMETCLFEISLSYMSGYCQ